MTTTFKDLGINSLLIKGLEAIKIKTPTSIQEKVIPIILNQKEDVVALAKQEQVKQQLLVYLYYRPLMLKKKPFRQ